MTGRFRTPCYPIWRHQPRRSDRGYGAGRQLVEMNSPGGLLLERDVCIPYVSGPGCNLEPPLLKRLCLRGKSSITNCLRPGTLLSSIIKVTSQMA